MRRGQSGIYSTLAVVGDMFANVFGESRGSDREDTPDIIEDESNLALHFLVLWYGKTAALATKQEYADYLAEATAAKITDYGGAPTLAGAHLVEKALSGTHHLGIGNSTKLDALRALGLCYEDYLCSCYEKKNRSGQAEIDLFADEGLLDPSPSKEPGGLIAHLTDQGAALVRQALL